MNQEKYKAKFKKRMDRWETILNFFMGTASRKNDIAFNNLIYNLAQKFNPKELAKELDLL